MVAEPVHATLETLNYAYLRVGRFLSDQKETLSGGGYIGALNFFNPFTLEKNGVQESTPPHFSWSEKAAKHIEENKTTYTCFLVAGVGLSSYAAYLYVSKERSLNGGKRKRFQSSKRRVPRLANGARKDVVLVVGSPTEPLTRLIALDFEKRGFIVYLTILDEKDCKYVELNPITDDINYLNLSNSHSYEMQLMKFRNLLEMPVVPFHGAEAHYLRLKAITFSPSLFFPIGPTENVSIASWNKINDRFMVTVKLFSSGLLDLVRQHKSKIISITTSIVSTLQMPYHAPESVYQNSIRHYFTVLGREVKRQGISVTQVYLGNLNISGTPNVNNKAKISNIVSSEIGSWDDTMKSLYANNFSKSQLRSSPIEPAGKGSCLKDLYHILFDLAYSDKLNPTSVYFGAGARSYDYISKLLPQPVVEMFLT